MGELYTDLSIFHMKINIVQRQFIHNAPYLLLEYRLIMWTILWKDWQGYRTARDDKM